MMRWALVLLIVGTFLLIPCTSERAHSQGQIPTAYDLIAAVNALRSSNGLKPYAIDPLLMLSAQTQSDYLASQAPGPVSGHMGPGGSDADARAKAVGFPYVAGLDINENWASISVGSSFEELFNGGWSDDAHQHTMLHPLGQLVGAGISQSGDRLYIILDVAAYWGDAGKTLWPTSSAGVTGNAISQFIAPVKIATPRADGEVVHQVQPGQSLWSIAIKYGVSIDTIRRLNNISSDGTIYTGQKLIILPPGIATQTPTVLAITPSIEKIRPSQVVSQIDLSQPSPTPIPASGFSIDQNIIFLLLFILGGVGLILIFIGLRR